MCSAKLISFRVHGSHGNHLMSAPKPICSKHYPSTADCRLVCFAMVCTCALPIDPASKSIVPHLQKPDLHLCVYQHLLKLHFQNVFSCTTWTRNMLYFMLTFSSLFFAPTEIYCMISGLDLIKKTYTQSQVINKC